MRVFLAFFVFWSTPELVNQAQVSMAPSLAEYWQETSLGLQQMAPFLANCHREELEFMACVAALQSLGRRENLEVNVAGQWQATTSERLGEKEQLEPFQAIALSSEKRKVFPFLSLVEQFLEKISPNEKAHAIAAGINGYLSVRHDPHTYIIPMRYFEEVMSTSSSQLQNYGFLSRRVKSGAFVRKVFEGSQAARAGLKKGDQILSINEQSVDRMGLSELHDNLRLQPQRELRLDILTQTGEKRRIRLPGIEQKVANVVHRLLPGSRNVGLITMHRFTQESCAEVTNAIVDLQQSGAQGLILDLRDNPGGQVDEAACIANLFLPKGMNLFETRSFDGEQVRERYQSMNEPIFFGPLSVLINGGSASAAEIVAGVLKDNGRATLVGERSFGKGSFQDGQVWSANDKVAIFKTNGLFYFASGWTPQLVGLEPDVLAPTPEGETLREEDLYYNPVRPFDLWNGPQTLSWLQDDCEGFTPQILSIEDQQVQKALNQTLCRVGEL